MQLLGNYKRLSEIVKKEKSALSLEEEYIISQLKKDKLIIKKCDQLIFVANHSYRRAYSFDKKIKNKSTVINNAIIDEYNNISCKTKKAIRQKYFINTNTCIILFVGRLDELKGLSHLLLAYRQVLIKHSNIHLFLAGDGDYTKWISETSNICHKVSFLGYLSNDKLSEFYSIANIGIVSSLHEEFGYVAIEMMMNKISIIVHDTSGLSEIVKHKTTGLKYKIKKSQTSDKLDVSELVNSISLLIEKPLYAKEIAKNGRKRFIEKYEFSNFEKAMINFYNNL